MSRKSGEGGERESVLSVGAERKKRDCTTSWFRAHGKEEKNIKREARRRSTGGGGVWRVHGKSTGESNHGGGDVKGQGRKSVKSAEGDTR